MEDTLKEPALEKPASPPRKRSRAAFGLVLLLAVAAAGGAGQWWWRAHDYETTDDAFIAGHVTTVSPQVAGRVRKVLVGDNQKVFAGDVLIELDPATFQVKLDQAMADLSEAQQKLQETRSQHQVSLAAVEQAKADTASAEAQAANAATDLVRYNTLVHSGAVSQQAHDNADTVSRTSSSALQAARKHVAALEAQVALAATQIHTAEAAVEKSRASVEQARLDLSYTEIKASVAGRVTNKSVEPGDYAQAGQAIMSLVRDDIWVVANFKETQLTKMRPGQPVTLTVDTYPDLELKGHVDSLQAGTGAAFSMLPAENATGNYVKVVQRLPVKIVFENLPAEGYHLAPGMSVSPQVQVRGAMPLPQENLKQLAIQSRNLSTHGSSTVE